MESVESQETELMQHRAAQYLASFAINFLEKKDDDSHTNMGWDASDKALFTHTAPGGQSLRLQLDTLTLTWAGKRNFDLDLVGRSHGEVVTWLHHCAIQAGLEEYDFYLHYKIDSGKLFHDQIYYPLDSDRNMELITLRDSAQKTLMETVEYFDMKSDIRIWPHHFDTGAFETRNEMGIGFGMAIPDKMIDDHYLYVSGYKGEGSLSPEGFSALTKGDWRDEGFRGATLATTGLDPEDWATFFKEAIQAYL